MIITFIRTFIIFITLFIVMRLLGKRQIGEMQPYEFIVTLIIADLACVPMADLNIPLIYGIVGILALFIFHQVISLIEKGGDFVKKVVSGKPSIVIDEMGVNVSQLKSNCMDIDDLFESMRSLGYFSLDDVKYGIFETNGKLSALKNDDGEEKGSAPCLTIIYDRKINKVNSEKVNLNKEKLQEFLLSFGIKQKDVEVFTIDKNGRVYLKEKNKKYKILNIKENL